MNLCVWCWVFLKWQYQTKCTTLAFQLPHRNIPLTFESEKCLNYIKFNNGKVHGKTLNSKSTKLDTLASSCIKFYPNIFSTNRTVKKSIDLPDLKSTTLQILPKYLVTISGPKPHVAKLSFNFNLVGSWDSLILNCSSHPPVKVYLDNLTLT